MKFQVWSEGYLCSGMEGIPSRAMFHGEFEGETFSDACQAWMDTLSEEGKKDVDLVRLTFWGCRLFPSEEEARRFLG